MITSAKGHNGQIEVYENKIIIKRKGLLAFATQGFKGEKEIFINQISSVQLKKASMLINGYIQFTFMGGKEAKGGLFQAGSDENSVLFRVSQQKDFEKVKSAIENIISKSLVNNTQQSGSSADEIKKFVKLKNEGVITEEEFQKKKKELLGL